MVGDATVREVTTNDVRAACDLFTDIFEATGHVDGRVSIEVDPRLAHDTRPPWRAYRTVIPAGTPGRRCERAATAVWASTGVKDPADGDTRFVVELVAPGTVNTAPADHGVLRGNTIDGTQQPAAAVFESLRVFGIDLATGSTSSSGRPSRSSKHPGPHCWYRCRPNWTPTVRGGPESRVAQVLPWNGDDRRTS